MKVAIEIENLSKQYRLGVVGTKTLGEDLSKLYQKLINKNDYQTKDSTNDSDKYVWALKGIDLQVSEGEVLGIIGKNGAGKSTLLKILSKVTGPTKGVVRAKGRIASLLEVGTGFHPELTGRENVFLNGAILGMRKFEIEEKFDEILDFSGISKYIDTPVKRYSSGMRVRLGFAVAAHLEPEILVIDEVLAVGDVEFQNKCIEKMESVASSGRTILFVSHNINSVRNLCHRVMVLDKGESVFCGEVEEGIETYLALNSSTGEKKSTYENTHFENKIAYVEKASPVFTRSIEFIESKLAFEFLITIKEKIFGLYLGILIEDRKGNVLILSSSNERKHDVFRKIEVGQYNIEVSFLGKVLKPGEYFLTFSLRNGNKIHHKQDRAIFFEVVDTQTQRGVSNSYREKALIAPEVEYTVN